MIGDQNQTDADYTKSSRNTVSYTSDGRIHHDGLEQFCVVGWWQPSRTKPISNSGRNEKEGDAIGGIKWAGSIPDWHLPLYVVEKICDVLTLDHQQKN